MAFRPLLSHALRFHGKRAMSSQPSLADVPNPLPASFLRGGTSKGVFISSKHLPSDRNLWDPLFLKIMGSPDPYGRQLDGMGGGISSLSKICVVGPPDENQRGANVQYTFAQIGVTDTTVDYSGNCGNLSSMIGAFALDEGLCDPASVRITREGGSTFATVSCFNTNTNKIIETAFPTASATSPRAVLDVPQFEMAGVPGMASKIVLKTLDPAGARTGKLTPSGQRTDALEVPGAGLPRHIPASLVDACNPSIFVSKVDVQELCGLKGREIDYNSPAVLSFLEDIRRAGAVEMGLSPLFQAQPKIAVVSPPDPSVGDNVDIVVRALSMGVLHKAVPMTLGLCLAVAAGLPGTIPHSILHPEGGPPGNFPFNKVIRMSHPTGVVETGAEFTSPNDVRSVQVFRTGKRLMRGEVYW